MHRQFPLLIEREMGFSAPVFLVSTGIKLSSLCLACLMESLFVRAGIGFFCLGRNAGDPHRIDCGSGILPQSGILTTIPDPTKENLSQNGMLTIIPDPT